MLSVYAKKNLKPGNYWNVALSPIWRCANHLSLGIVSQIYSYARPCQAKLLETQSFTTCC